MTPMPRAVSRCQTKRLALADPANSEWQRDLIFSYVMIAEYSPQSAQKYYQMALAVTEKLHSGGKLTPKDAPMLKDIKTRLAQSKLVKS